MGKKLCSDREKLASRVKGKKKRYICTKCDRKSPREKWCCKPREIKR